MEVNKRHIRACHKMRINQLRQSVKDGTIDVEYASVIYSGYAQALLDIGAIDERTMRDKVQKFGLLMQGAKIISERV